MTQRIQLNTSVSTRTRQQVRELADQLGCTQHDVVTVAIDRYHHQLERSNMTDRLWIVDWQPGNDCVIPSPSLCPNLDDFEILVADQFFSLVRADYGALSLTVNRFPYWRISGHPADGRYISEGGDQVYIFDATMLDTEEQLWDALGLKPETFGGDTWDDVDDDIVRNHVDTF